MADFTARLDLRVSTGQRARLEWLADHLELPPAAVVRALLDGISGIDGIELVPTLHRLANAEPHYDQVTPVAWNLPAKRDRVQV